MNELIEWPRAQYWDKPWNPIVGCWPCSPACDNCYARSMLQRFGQSLEPHETSKVAPPQKGVVFCGNMTDLFGEWVPITANFDMLARMWHHPDPHGGPKPLPATYLWCTKRANRMAKVLENYTNCPNAYFGFTAENDYFFHARRAEIMDNMGQESRERQNFWISAEPLLGPIDMYAYLDGHIPFKWVVVGCESGPGRRDCRIEWVERIVECCQDAEVPVFIKQLDLGGECVTDINRFPEHLRIRQVPWARKEQA